MQEISIQCKILDPRVGRDVPMPKRATEFSAGVDLRACLDSPLELRPREVQFVPTGLAFFINNPEWVGIILPRSGLAHKHGVVLGNLAGVIDSDYQGEVKISAWNRGEQAYTIKVGERIAQVLFVPVGRARFEIVNEFAATQRGDGGFGHTGSL